ncbi:hypothetical protein T05_4594, partial [Trichinella murrelli]
LSYTFKKSALKFTHSPCPLLLNVHLFNYSIPITTTTNKQCSVIVCLNFNSTYIFSDFHKKSTLLKQNVALLAFDFCSSHSDSLRKTWKYSNATMRKQADERVEATLRSPIRHTCIKILACRFGPFGHADSFWNRARVLSETVQLYLFAVLLRCPDVS